MSIVATGWKKIFHLKKVVYICFSFFLEEKEDSACNCTYGQHITMGIHKSDFLSPTVVCS